jgi:putative transposase
VKRIPPSERGIWQRRFWEHVIRDERDYELHVDYLHYNPVKHGHVTRVADWPYSSFHRYVQRGIYDLEWGANDDVRGLEMEEGKRRDALRFPALRAAFNNQGGA